MPGYNRLQGYKTVFAVSKVKGAVRAFMLIKEFMFFKSLKVSKVCRVIKV